MQIVIQSYPRYITDWRESETRLALSMGERALYWELLDYCYLEGSLPGDPSQLAKISACHPNEFKKLFPKVRALFFEDGNRLYHAKVNEVRKKLESYHEQKSHAGSASGRARRQRSLSVRSTGVEPSPSPSPSPSPKPSTPVCAAEPSPGFVEWWKIWADVRGTNHRMQAERKFFERVTVRNFSQCLQCTESYLAGPGSNGSGYNPENFLEEQFRDDFQARWPAAASPNGRKLTTIERLAQEG